MSQPDIIDSHCHIDFAEFEQDRELVLKRAYDNGVKHIIVPAVAKNSWQTTIKTCRQYNNLHLALGLHPVFINQHQIEHLTELETEVKKHKPVAIGEIGLDFYLKDLKKDKQLTFFEAQLELANQKSLPVILHVRKAHDEALKLLQKHQPKGGIAHAFNGSIQQAYKYIELGFKLGFGGMLTFERSNKLRKLVKQLPLEAIVLETDAPDMTVSQYKGERNSPEYLPHVLQAIAEIKNEPLQEIADITCANIKQLFKLNK